MFQAANLVGGYDADESAFCFSLYEGDHEYWFQLTLDDVAAINNGKKNVVQVVTSDC